MNTEIIDNPSVMLQNVAAHIPADKYIAEYRDSERFMGYCRQCRRYGKTYACPPFDFDVDDYISGYRDVYIIGTKIVFDDLTRESSATVKLRDEITNNAMFHVLDEMAVLHKRVLAVFPDTLSFLVGKCRLCLPQPCARLEGKPCLHPDEVRHSIESVGFDVGKTTSDLLGIELKWSNNHRLPDYVTLVTAFFTNAEQSEFCALLKQMFGCNVVLKE